MTAAGVILSAASLAAFTTSWSLMSAAEEWKTPSKLPEIPARYDLGEE